MVFYDVTDFLEYNVGDAILPTGLVGAELCYAMPNLVPSDWAAVGYGSRYSKFPSTATLCGGGRKRVLTKRLHFS